MISQIRLMKPGLGRKKKEILDEEELQQYNAFQDNLWCNVRQIGWPNLSEKEASVARDLLEFDDDDQFTAAKKKIMFKRYFLHKPLTQEECTYFIETDSHGKKPTAEKKLSKMAVCKIEHRAVEKCRQVMMKSPDGKLCWNEMKDAMLGFLQAREYAQAVDLESKSKELA